MKYPIPPATDDWVCLEIHWPGSVEWLGLLRGLLSLPMRGRTWDERSGIVADAQAVGWEIWLRNADFNPCAGNSGGTDCPDCPDCLAYSPAAKGVGAHGFQAVLEELEDMGQVVTDVQVIGGKIRVFFGPCCYKDLEGIDLSADTDEELDAPYAPATGEDTNTYSACAKAWAVVDAIEAMMNAAFDVVGSSILPWMWPGRVETLMDMNLNDKWSTAMIIDWLGLGILVTPENAFTDSDQQKSAQALALVFDDSPDGVPDEATYTAIKSALHTRGLIYDGLIMTAVAALGRANLDRVVKLGALADETRDCAEPVDFGLTIPVAHDWALLVDFRTGLHGFSDAAGKWVNGVGFRWPGMVKYDSIPGTARVLDAGVVGSTVKYMAFHMVQWPNFVGTGAGTNPHQFQIGPTIYWDYGDWVNRAAWQDVTLSQVITAGQDIRLADQLQVTDNIVVGDDTCIWDLAVIAGTGPVPFADIDAFPE